MAKEFAMKHCGKVWQVLCQHIVFGRNVTL